MYCEIMIQHRWAILPDRLEAAIRSSFGNTIPLDQAYARSALYRSRSPSISIFAFDLARNCFVILRKVSNVRSTFHLEGSDDTVGVDTMLDAVQEFADELAAIFRRSDYRVRDLTVRLFEDNGRETGMERQARDARLGLQTEICVERDRSCGDGFCHRIASALAGIRNGRKTGDFR
jgi:hypothetical protein